MTRFVLRRPLAVLLLSLTLAVPWCAAAAPPDVSPVAPASPDLLARLWSWLTGVWAEVGCGIDPGGCAAPKVDEGCGIDPSGCAAPKVDVGCGIDPSGSPCRE
jgi:hypothetical protein